MRRFVYPRTAGIITKGSNGSTAPTVRVVPQAATRAQLVLALALEADVDVRSARKAIEEGPDAVRGRAGERIRLAASSLGIALGTSTNNGPKPSSAV